MQSSFRSVLAAGALLSLPAQAASFTFPTLTLTVPDGFEVELVAGPPLVLRPMMADFDEAGRLYVADSSGSNDKVEKQLEEKPHRIVRLEDTDGDGRYDRSVVFADKLMFPEGVLWHEGGVYTGAPPTIWKLEDTDGDGVADRRTPWHEGNTLTGCANDLHGPYLGPDGWIYWCKGAFARQTYERPGRRPISDSAAHIFRALPDRTELDSVMGGGMDNPVEVAFSREGEVFFITTFFHHPQAGLRDAIVHCIYGGAYPKVHGVVDALQQTGELLPALVELGPAAACAISRYDSTVFGAEFENNLFSAEFNLRKVMRHVFEPVGSTYRSVNSDFLVADNPDFHPTDVFEDADGSLLVIDTGGWYKICCPTSQLAKPDILGGIYRIRRTGVRGPEDPRGLKLRWEQEDPGAWVARLGDPRPAVRNRAVARMAASGSRSVPALARILDESPSSLARANAVWALTRMAGDPARVAVRLALDDQDVSVRRAALHSVGMRADRGVLTRVVASLRSSDRFEQRKAAEALGRMRDPTAVPALLAVAGTFWEGFPEETNALRIHEHAIIFALIEIADAVQTRRGLGDGNPLVRRAALIALDQMDHGGLTAADVTPLLASNEAVLEETALWIAGHHPDWGGALAGFFRDRLRSAGVSASRDRETGRRLARFAKDAAIQQLIAERLQSPALAVDTRLMLLRAMAASGARELPGAWLGVLPSLFSSPDPVVARAALATLRALPWSKANAATLREPLLRVGSDTGGATDVRLAALAAVPGGVGALAPGVFAMLVEHLGPSVAPEQRGWAANVLAQASLATAQQEALAEQLRAVGPMELNRLLEAFREARTEAVGLALVASLKASESRAALRADLVVPLLARFPASVQEAGRELLALLDVDPARQAAQLDALLAELKTLAGDVRRGQAVFNSPQAACATCHALGYLGGTVGPDLTSIGQIRTERDLLEAVVFPNASFVRSFEPVLVSTKDGEETGGVLKNETEEEFVLVTGADTLVRIAKSDVTGMRPGTVSIMPSGLADQLSRQAVADLLAFLKNTRSGAH